MNLIRISNEYSLDVEKYNALQVGDVIKSKSELRKRICYPLITSAVSNSGTGKRLQAMIDRFIGYEKAGGNKIKILSLEEPDHIESIVESAIMTGRIITKPHRDYILDNIVRDKSKSHIYMPTSEIIREATDYNLFFYDYNNIHFSRECFDKNDWDSIQKFAVEYDVKDTDYLIDVMDVLNGSLYAIFKRSNIESWAKRRNIAVKRVLCERKVEMNAQKALNIEQKYFEPLKQKHTLPHILTKIANIQYMKDNGISKQQHNWFYYAYKFTLPNSFTVNVNPKDFQHHKEEISRKAIYKLKLNAMNLQGGNLTEMISKIVL